jgi:anti-anti-sigma regulatory factor
MFVKTASILVPGGLDINDFEQVKDVFALAEWADEAILDFSELSSISATVLGALIAMVNRMVGHNRLGVVRIVGANAGILRIFRLCRAESLFDLSACIEPASTVPFVSDAGRAALRGSDRVYVN